MKLLIKATLCTWCVHGYCLCPVCTYCMIWVTSVHGVYVECVFRPCWEWFGLWADPS